VDRKKRLDAVRAAISTGAVAGQEELRALLAKSGVETSQASLSRDLKAIGATRARHPKLGWVYELPVSPPALADEADFRRRFKSSVRGVRRSSFVVLLSTPPGEASLVGRLVDEARGQGIVGSIAGDDTVLCVAANEKAARAAEKRWKEILG